MVRDESRQVDRQACARYIDVLVTGAVTECISAVQCKRWQPQGISQERKLTHTEITQMGSQRERENKSGCLERLGEGQVPLGRAAFRAGVPAFLQGVSTLSPKKRRNPAFFSLISMQTCFHH